jgi:hypothetical protein
VLLGPTEKHHSFGIYCHGECQRYYSLVDLFYAQESGNLLHLHTEIDACGKTRNHTALRLQWTTRLLEKAGVLHIRELGAPTLPPNAPDDARDLWSILQHVRRIRSMTRDQHAPLPFSLRFVQDWVGKVGQWTSYAFNRAKRWLIAHGYLELAVKDGICALWRVGSQALRMARRHATVLSTEQAIVRDVDATVLPEPAVPTSACPDADMAWHDPRRCTLCQVQAMLVEARLRQRGYGDYPDPTLQGG